MPFPPSNKDDDDSDYKRASNISITNHNFTGRKCTNTTRTESKDSFSFSFTDSDIRNQTILLNTQYATSLDTDIKNNRPCINNLGTGPSQKAPPNLSSLEEETEPLLRQRTDTEPGADLLVKKDSFRIASLEEHAMDGSSSNNKKSRGVYKAPKISNPEVNLKRLAKGKSHLIKKFGELGFWDEVMKTAVTSIPAVLVGIMLTILDGVSYGLLIFPTNMKYFSSFGPDGITLFFLSTFISQFVYSMGGSVFKSANGGFMIEVVPFLHTICKIVYNEHISKNEEKIVPTILIAFALGSIVTGLVFLLMGYFKLGVIMEYFPRHILIGCIGGVGMFLIITGLEITTEVTFEYSLIYLKKMFLYHTFAKWGVCLFVSVGVRALGKKIKHPLFTPVYFISVAVIFYVAVFLLGLNMEDLRKNNWIFKVPKPMKPFYDIYTRFSLSNTDFLTVFKLIPVMLSLTFFGILHVPINVPSLAVSVDQTNVNVNRELLSHGVSNIVSGLCGSVQNYLIYSNSVLFIKSGGTSRVSGIMLGIATIVLFFFGPNIIGYVPLPLVGSLVFHMGIDLAKEAIYDTFGQVHILEYLTINTIVISMTLLGFVEGIILGIAVACVFFVLLYSNKSPIRSFFTGKSKRSLVRRLYLQRKYISDVGNQIQGIMLQGYLFFGSIHRIDYAIRDLIHSSKENTNSDEPKNSSTFVKYIIIDFRLVSGIDFSAADAFKKIQRRLFDEKIHLIICGVTIESEITKALVKAGITPNGEKNNGYIEYFHCLNSALEWSENKLLSVYYTHRNLGFTESQTMSRFPTDVTTESKFLTSTSPRKRELIAAAKNIHDEGLEASVYKMDKSPMQLFIQAFQDIMSDVDQEALKRFFSYFENCAFEPDEVLWEIGDLSDCFYVCESGSVKSMHRFKGIEENILPGTIFGDVSFFIDQPRISSKVVGSKGAVLWKLDRNNYQNIFNSDDKKDWELAVALIRHTLIFSVHDSNILIDQLRINYN